MFDKSGWTTGYSMPHMFTELGVTKLIVGSEIGNLYLYNNIDGNLGGVLLIELIPHLFHINEGTRCAPFYEDITKRRET
jgi:hypothetical protein